MWIPEKLLSDSEPLTKADLLETIGLIEGWEIAVHSVSSDWESILIHGRHVWEIYIIKDWKIHRMSPNWSDNERNRIKDWPLLSKEITIVVDWEEYDFTKKWIKDFDIYNFFWIEVWENKGVKKAVQEAWV